jgi:hypothetical protein
MIAAASFGIGFGTVRFHAGRCLCRCYFRFARQPPNIAQLEVVGLGGPPHAALNAPQVNLLSSAFVEIRSSSWESL